MYAPPPAAAAGGAGRSGLAASGPILAICCLLFILFLIATTIVLALIPVYLSRRDGTTNVNSRQYLNILDPQTISTSGKRQIYNAFDSDYTLPSDQAAPVGTAMEVGLLLTSGSIIIDECKTGVGARKRRGFGILREARTNNGVKLYCKFRFNLGKCTKCGSAPVVATFVNFPAIVKHTLLYSTKSYERTITYLCRITSSLSGYPTGTSGITAQVVG